MKDLFSPSEILYYVPYLFSLTSWFSRFARETIITLKRLLSYAGIEFKIKV
jgi:hypothetical protein